MVLGVPNNMDETIEYFTDDNLALSERVKIRNEGNNEEETNFKVNAKRAKKKLSSAHSANRDKSQ